MYSSTAILILLTFCENIFSQTVSSSEPVISSHLGQYRGSIPFTNSFGKPIISFRGIRYAQPPINQLRFKPPVPIKKHVGVYDATKDGPVCPQLTQEPMSEDCLMLNVYTTKIPKGSQHLKRPVIVVIHSGNFFNGTARSNWEGPQYLMNQDIVVVTFNYRLGIFGFMSTGDKELPGNNGLKDQVVAMKWVKNNIGVFGGDPSSITLFGYGAGAISIALHLVSPMSKGLFNKAVISSGSAFGQFPIHNNQLDLVRRQATIVGCTNDSPSKIIKCLRRKHTDVLANSFTKLFENGENPITSELPVIENDFGQERFLTDHPIKLILEGKFQHVPVIIGIAAEEYSDKAIEVSENENLLQQLDQQWEKIAPIILMYERNTNRSREISEDLRYFYFGEKHIDKSSQLPLIHIFNDATIGFGADRGAKLLAMRSSQPVYYYRCSYRGQYGNKKIKYGPTHFEDLTYFFYISTMYPEYKPTDKDFHAVDGLMTILANFATRGNPTPEAMGKLNNVIWLPFNLTTQKYLDFNNEVTLMEKLHTQRYAEWEKLFPLSQYL